MSQVGNATSVARLIAQKKTMKVASKYFAKYYEIPKILNVQSGKILPNMATFRHSGHTGNTMRSET